MLVLPADHVIKDVKEFQRVVELGRALAEKGKLVTFGVAPDRAETGFGYIKKGTAEGNGFVVEQFVEKPSLALAEKYVSSGDYLWNSGMFLFKASVFLTELGKFQGDIVQAVKQSVDLAVKDLDFLRLDSDAFSASPSNSIDYAVMEKTDKAVVLPLNIQWSDIGSWSALWALAEHDESGNVMEGDVLCHNVTGSYIRSEKRLVAAIGLEDVIIVETVDAVLVADKNCAQEVNSIVERLKEASRNEADVHQQVFRPWGSYETIDECARFKVKRIIVNPGSRLSLQMHYHRAEHWVVVNGTAKITRDDEVQMLSEDQSTYIPIGANHRLENPGVIPLEIIEIQTGSYLGEDDIVRLSDEYGRVD
jgi:mannose-1-phosphate guanylyltransferase/mannose-6-phosphate isomerase